MPRTSARDCFPVRCCVIYKEIPAAARQVSSGPAVTVVAKSDVVPYSTTFLVTASRASRYASITSRPPAPWMSMSRKPGIAIFSSAEISVPPAGTLKPLRGPIASITSSRMRMPASWTSEAGVKARPAWIRVVGMACNIVAEMKSRTKQCGQTNCVSLPAGQIREGFCLLGRHGDVGQLERVAFHRALDGYVMAGMRRYFVLRVDHVHLLVGVVHEDVLGSMLFDALHRTFRSAGLVVCPLCPALAVGNPAGHGAVCRHRECPSEKRRCDCH